MNAVPWVQHYEAQLVESCGCHACTGWREARQKVIDLQCEVVAHKHRCRCTTCCELSRAAYMLRAASNKLDVVTEVAFHAAFDKDLKPFAWEIMEKLGVVMGSADYQSPNFWAQSAGEMPMGFWLRRVADPFRPSGALAMVL